MARKEGRGIVRFAWHVFPHEQNLKELAFPVTDANLPHPPTNRAHSAPLQAAQRQDHAARKLRGWFHCDLLGLLLSVFLSGFLSGCTQPQISPTPPELIPESSAAAQWITFLEREAKVKNNYLAAVRPSVTLLTEEIRAATPPREIAPLAVGPFHYFLDDSIHGGPLLRRTGGNAEDWSLLLGSLMPGATLAELRISPDGSRIALSWAIGAASPQVITLLEPRGATDAWRMTEPIRDFVWGPGGREIIAAGERTGRAATLWRLRPGDETAVLLYALPDDQGQLILPRTNDPKRLFMAIEDGAANKLFELDLNPAGESELRPVFPNTSRQQSKIIHCAEQHWTLTSATPQATPRLCRGLTSSRHCLDLPGAQQLACGENILAIVGRSAGRPQLWQVPQNAPIRLVKHSLEPSESALTLLPNLDPENRPLEVLVSSPIHAPRRVTVAATAAADETVSTILLTSPEDSRYHLESHHARASDGVAIPVTLVWRNDAEPLANRPLLIRGYGAYGIPLDPIYRPEDKVLLDHGGIVALAHIRGGGEFGAAWHDAGRSANKVVSFTDFVAVAEYLRQHQIGSPRRTVAFGRSAGAQTVLSALGLAPHLFSGVILEAPYLSRCPRPPTLTDLRTPQKELWDIPEWGSADQCQRWCLPVWQGLRQRKVPVFIAANEGDERAPISDTFAALRALREASPADVILTIHPRATHNGPAFQYARQRAAAEALQFIVRPIQGE